MLIEDFLNSCSCKCLTFETGKIHSPQPHIMSGGIEIYSTVATLPAPFDAENGRTFATPVQSLHGSRKRKRHEIVASVDGESVNIYNV